MQFRRSDFADLSYFLEIARRRSFRRAGLELGVSTSALSHALRGLEARLGVRLLNRTSRSVTLTAAGEALQAAVAQPFDEIGLALEVVNQFRDAPMGRLRLSVPDAAADYLVGPVLAAFVERSAWGHGRSTTARRPRRCGRRWRSATGTSIPRKPTAMSDSRRSQGR